MGLGRPQCRFVYFFHGQKNGGDFFFSRPSRSSASIGSSLHKVLDDAGHLFCYGEPAGKSTSPKMSFKQSRMPRP